MLGRLMDEHGITLTELSKMVGLEKRAIIGHMNGFCMSDNAARIYAKAFGISFDRFLES